MKSLVRTLIPSVIFSAALAAGLVAPHTLAQARPSAQLAPAASAQRGPDLLGLYPGMPAEAGRRCLQAHSDSVRVQDVQNFTFSLNVNDSGGSDQITVYLTAPPNPPAAWAIVRNVNYHPSNSVATSTLLATLCEKYGKETASLACGSTNTSFWWLFDLNGQRVASGDPCTLATYQAAFQNNMNMSQTGPPPSPYAPWQPCFSSYYALHVSIGQSYGPELVNNFSAALVNLPLGYRAAMATRNAQNAAAEAAKQQELEKAKTKKPVL